MRLTKHTSIAMRPAVRVVLRIAAVSALALGVANCSTAPRTQGQAAKVDPKYGVKPSPRVVTNGKVPKGGGRAVVGKPYVVAGKKFVPDEDEDYVAVGTASWYGAAFHGRKTANGEIFDRHSIAAAHPTLPLPSYVRVTNLSNQRSMVVRVNDRGPFHGNRLIDLSKGAAQALDFDRQGTARVKVEYVGRASLNGSDDRKLLATLNAGAPAVIPAVAPATPAVAPAPVMVASAEPRVEETAAPVAEQVPVQADTAVASEAAAAPVQVAQAETAVSAAPQSMEQAVEQAQAATQPASAVSAYAPVQVAAVEMPLPPAREPGRIVSLQAPVAASVVPNLQMPARRTSTYLQHAAPQHEVQQHDVQLSDVPLPPVRPAEPGVRRSLFAREAAVEAPAPRRSVVADLSSASEGDSAGIYFEPMALSDLTPQRFGAGKDAAR